MFINQPFRQRALTMGLLLPLLAASGCTLFPPSAAQPASGQRGRPGGTEGENRPISVETAIAETGALAGVLTYTGTTRPAQQVTLKAQVSGTVIDLLVDVGDQVAQGRLIAQLDGDLQTTNVNQAQAELSARRAATVQAEVSIQDAQATVGQAQATYDQARLDAERLRQLADQGAISLQEAEAAELAANNAQQAVVSAQAQVAAQQQAVAAAADQTDAQQALVVQTQQQLARADLRSPLTGVVLSRQVDIGDFVESGDTVLELGDLRNLEVTVQVSALEIGQLQVEQPVRVGLDAFPEEGSIAGQVARIAPVADVTSRLVPVQVSLPNVDGRVGSGLLARVTFASGAQDRVVVPESALNLSDGAGEGGGEGGGKAGAAVFVVEGSGEQAKAIARPVRVGESRQNRVEILSGLSPGETFVVQSDRPLTPGQAVRLSILSEQVF
ncbi:MAG: efflux RND transporter periplasmic adaptor subunit [Cyanobacteria bacterium J06598_3]